MFNQIGNFTYNKYEIKKNVFLLPTVTQINILLKILLQITCGISRISDNLWNTRISDNIFDIFLSKEKVNPLN